MITTLALCLFTILNRAAAPLGQSDQTAIAAKTGPASGDPYAPLRLYDGEWDVTPAGSDKAAEIVHLENRCAKAGDFFVCNQIVKGKNMALIVFLPTHPLESGGYAYRNQALRPDSDGPSSWGSLEITGDHWVYLSEATDQGKKVYFRTTNTFSGSDKIHFEVQHSDDGSKWRTQMSEDEVRVK
jgi:hypothetical protein